ncbi:MAG: proteasome assembly chaperone 4 family protein [Candidatus Heimdallarchaeota archaeon]
MPTSTTDDSPPFFSAENENLQLVAIIYQNGLFVSISKNEALLLGTTAISLPFSENIGLSRSKKQDGFERKGLTTATVLGSRNEIYTKALAEKITQRTGDIVYLSLNIKENETNLYGEAIELVESLLHYLQEGQQSENISEQK